jgi:hypothetical protein
MPNARCFDVIVRCIIAEHNSIRPCGNERRPTMKWEYHFFVVATGQSLVESSINELGKEGWELVTTYMNPSGATYFVFKRPIK